MVLRIDYGNAEGLTLSDFKTRYPNLQEGFLDKNNLSFTWPNGESRYVFYERVYRSVEEIVSINLGNTVVVVSHRLALGCFIANKLAGNPSLWKQYSMQPCSVTEMKIVKENVSTPD